MSDVAIDGDVIEPQVRAGGGPPPVRRMPLAEVCGL
jgi:hypothetical protein